MAAAKDPSAAEKKKLQEEKKKLKSEQRQQKKEARKRAKELSAQEAELSADEEGGGFFTFLATLAIILVWLAILCVVIKLDVGGFGSNVLTPLLKDIPVVNLILPEPKTDETPSTDNGGYTSISDAVDQIKSLELQLQEAQSQNLQKDEQIASLNQEVARLQQFENAQTEFNRIQLEFFNEVVYSDKGPGAEEYRKYYEEINPTLADTLYKQVVEQMEENAEIQDYAAAYSSMKPKAAAAIFESMTDNLNLVARILSTMSAESRGDILGVMDAEVAARLTKIMDPES